MLREVRLSSPLACQSVGECSKCCMQIFDPHTISPLHPSHTKCIGSQRRAKVWPASSSDVDQGISEGIAG